MSRLLCPSLIPPLPCREGSGKGLCLLLTVTSPSFCNPPPHHHPCRLNFQGGLLTFTQPPISLFCIWGNRGLENSRSRCCFYYTNGVETFLKQQSCPPWALPLHPFLLSELAALFEWWRPRELEPHSLAFQPKPSVGPSLSRFESLMSDPLPHPLPNHTPGKWEKQDSSTNWALDVIAAGRYHLLLQEVGGSVPLPNMVKTGQEQN